MARSPIEIAISSETGAFEKGIKSGLIKPIEDADKKLDELGRNNGPEQLERAIEQAQRETKDLASETRRTADIIDREFKDAYRKTRAEASGAMDGSSESVKEFKSEALQNLSEVSSSFSGDLTSIGDLAQGTFGGLAASLPGALGAAGAGAAVGVGLITAALGAAEAKRKELSERANDLARAYLDAGSQVLDTMTLVSRTNDVLTDDDKRKKAEDYAKKLGIDLPTAARAMAGDLNAMNLVQKITNETMEDYSQITSRAGGSMRGVGSEVSAQVSGWKSLIEAGKELIGVNTEANQKFADTQAALQGMIRDAGTATESVDEVGNRLLTLPDTTQILIDAKTGQATTNIEKFRGDLDGNIPTVKTVTIKFNADTSDFDRKMSDIQRRAADGQDVTVPVRMGKLWY